jgi:hypothetical protein
MKKWTEDELIEAGYKIRNAKITGVDLSMADHGCLTMFIWIHADHFDCGIGGYCLGHGYLGADDEFFDGSAKGTESIARIMDVIGVEKFSQIKGKVIRIVDEGLGKSINIFGNIIEDKWFDEKSFFADGE